MALKLRDQAAGGNSGGDETTRRGRRRETSKRIEVWALMDMDAETVRRLADALDRELAEALGTLEFLAARLPELVRSRRGALEAIARDLSARTPGHD